ncbi:MAG: hypothetical protein ABI551_23375 [Polyangiaceae bacterium]
MGTWLIDTESKPGILQLILSGTFTVEEMRAVHTAHNAAIDAYGRADYRVFCDLRDLAPLSPGCASILESAKTYSSSHKNFRGSAVWVKSALIALQHRRTSESGGVMDTELISEDVHVLWKHLDVVNRMNAPKGATASKDAKRSKS